MNTATTRRRPTNLSLHPELLALANKLEINVSKAAESGIAQAVAQRRAELWLEANGQALESSNAYIEKNGLPLGQFRNF